MQGIVNQLLEKKRVGKYILVLFFLVIPLYKQILNYY